MSTETWDCLPRLAPMPLWCRGEDTPSLCLDGAWEAVDAENGSVRPVELPFDMGIWHRQGLISRRYTCRRTVSVPKQAGDARRVLRFEGVNGAARVLIDGEEAARHENGFLTWNVDVTDLTAGKRRFTLEVEIDETVERVSAYNHGGILHSVYLLLLPCSYVSALILTPLLDDDFAACVLRADLDVAGLEPRHVPGRFSLRYRLLDPDGQPAASVEEPLSVRHGGYYTLRVPVERPRLWDAEHPNLYTFEAELCLDGAPIERVARRTGLRKIERAGCRLLVNGREVKLRGACRHEITPRRGRAVSREWIRRDVELFREANLNYIRTSHYPPSEYFLDLCDEAGIYVEDELALAFIARTLPYTQRDPEERERYLSHFTECFARDCCHPSVIIWSLCNESFGGFNFDALNRLTHRLDPTRMTKFSYPMTIAEEHEEPDIWSIHYSEVDADLGKKHDNLSLGGQAGRDHPVLHDEFAHVACYNREEMRRDPAVRVFWGEGLRRFWDAIWSTDGALGGAIWAGIDETDIYDGGNTQLEWGIADVWRRKKPEWYMTRKAFSPVKLFAARWKPEQNRLVLALENRFCHTDLAEVSLAWRCGEESGTLALPKARPGEAIRAVLPLTVASSAPALRLSFTDPRGVCVEETELRRAALPALFPESDRAVPRGPLTIAGEDAAVCVSGDGFAARFSKETGLLLSFTCGDEALLTGAQSLNAPYFQLGDWILNEFSCKMEGDRAVVVSRGAYRDTLALTWTVTVSPDGALTVSYRVDALFAELPRNLKLRVGVDDGGLDELGIAFPASAKTDGFAFARVIDEDAEDDYAWYPEGHLARNFGEAKRSAPQGVWGEPPVGAWEDDRRDDILDGKYAPLDRGTNDFRATKKNVREGWLLLGDSPAALGVGEGTHVRLETMQTAFVPAGSPEIRTTGTWYTLEDKKGGCTELWARNPGDAAELTFTGTGVVWVGPQDTTLGMARVLVDGVPAAERVSQRSAGCDFSCSSVGFDKKYGLALFSVEGLPAGEHTIRVEALGEKAPDASDTYIVITGFRVIDGKKPEPVRLLVNQDFAYPHISWGNYRKPPILLEVGSTGTVVLRAGRAAKGTAREAVESQLQKMQAAK